MRLGVNGEAVVEVVVLIELAVSTCGGVVCAISNLVIANPLGTLPEPLAFLFLAIGPEDAEGEACRDKLRGVMVADVVCDGAPPVREGWNCRLKFLCILCKSELECERRNGAKLPAGPDGMSKLPSAEKDPAPLYS